MGLYGGHARPTKKIAEAVFYSSTDGLRNLVQFEEGEAELINTGRLALALHKTPDEVRSLPLADVLLLWGIMDGDEQALEWRRQKK